MKLYHVKVCSEWKERGEMSHGGWGLNFLLGRKVTTFWRGSESGERRLEKRNAVGKVVEKDGCGGGLAGTARPSTAQAAGGGPPSALPPGRLLAAVHGS